MTTVGGLLAEQLEEQQPLLLDSIHTSNCLAQPKPTTPRLGSTRVVVFIAIIVFCLSIAGDLVSIPMVRVIEDAVCKDYYRSQDSQFLLTHGEIDEKLCKQDEIQSELAYIMGVQEMLDAITSFAFALPYGYLADRVGRTKIFTLSLLGIELAGIWTVIVIWYHDIFPVRAVWISSLFQVVGGGNGIPMTMVYSMIVDVQSEDSRTNTFFYINVCGLVAQLITPSMSAILMKESPWTPLFLGLLTLLFSMFLSLCLPETLYWKAPDMNIKTGASVSTTKLTRFEAQLAQVWKQIWDSMAMLRSRPFCLLLTTFFIEQLTTKTTRFGVRYTSKRFSWSIASFGYLLSIRAFVSIILLLVILPLLSSMLMSDKFPFHYTARDKDLSLARLSSIALVCGSLLTAGPTIGVVVSGFLLSTCGSGFSGFCRSLATTFVDQRHIAKLYTLLNIVDTIGAFLAGPLMAWAFIIGIRLRGSWLGLPYIVLAVCGTMAAVAIYCVRLPGNQDPVQDDVGEI